MSDFFNRSSQTPLTGSAKALLKRKSREFSEHLTAQAQLNARHEGHNLVADKHVEDAFAFVMRGRASRSRWVEFGAAFSGVIVGVALSFLRAEVTWEQGARENYTLWALAATLTSTVVMTISLMMRA